MSATTTAHTRGEGEAFGPPASDELDALRSAVRAVAVATIERADPHPDEAVAVPAAAIRAIDAMGLLSPLAVEQGGDGVPGPVAWTVIAEELGRADAGTALYTVLSAHAVIIAGRSGVVDLPRLTADRRGSESVPRGTLLYFEGYGRGPDELQAAGVDHDGMWSLTGRKIGVVRVQDSAFGIAVARVGSEIRAFHLSRSTLGRLRVVRSDPRAGAVGARAAETAIVELDGADGSRLLTDITEPVLNRDIATMRLAVGSILLGIGNAAVQYAAGYATTREAFGQPISAYQGVAFPLVEAEMELEGARLQVLDVAARIDTGEPGRAASEAVGQAVAAATTAATLATAVAVNTLGGHGYLADHPVERWYRDAAMVAALDFDPLLTAWSAGS